MEFIKLSEVPEAIKEFYFEEEIGGVVTLSNHHAGEHKDIRDIERVVALGKGNTQRVIEMFAPMVDRGSQWRWYQSYLIYLNSKEEWYNRSQEFVSEEGSEFQEVEPLAPVRPLSLSVEQTLAPYFGTLRAAKLKSARVTTSLGNDYDANELAISRLGMARLALEGQVDEYELMWSLASDDTGVMTTVTYKDLKEAHLLAATQMSTNWSK